MQEKTLELLQAQDAATQKQIYYAHCDRLMGVVYQYLGSVADAEEVLQDTFLVLFEKIHLFHPDKGNFKAWSHRIATNQALMFLRKKKRIKFTMSDLSEAVKANAFVAKIDQEKGIEIDRYLNKLPSKSAIVFRLKVIEGYSHEEIADLLQIKTTASRAIFSRARKKLQYYFKEPTTTF